MSYTTPKPRWWPSDLRGTDANSGDGWVGSCVAACLKELVQKWAKTLGIRTACSNTDAGPAVPVVSLLLRYITTEIPSIHVCAMSLGHLADSLTQTKQSERLAESNRASLPTELIDRHY